jgi:molybdopterin molybdotransferase
MTLHVPSALRSRHMAGIDEAFAAVVSLAAPLSSESVPLEAAHGRVLSEALIADHAAPAFAVSAMDGYAIREADMGAAPFRLRIVGESFAGDPRRTVPLEPGCCVRIYTGAPVPAGADRVVVQEMVRRDGSEAVFELASDGGPNIRPAGSDFAVGEVLLEARTRLTSQALIAAAAADQAELMVCRRPRVILLSTGDELAAPGEARARPGAIPESVSLGVAALARDWGAEVVARRRVGDDLALLTAAARAALDEADIIVVTGGASVGARDFARAMFEPFGLEVVVDKVAMKPGKPVWVGRAGGRIVVGLPGNPSAAMVTARLFLVPMLAVMGGRDAREAWQWRPAPLVADLPACGDRECVHRARIAGGGVLPIRNQDSSAQKALATAELLLRRRPDARALNAGELVEVLAF